jgi:hypothetical protein
MHRQRPQLGIAFHFAVEVANGLFQQAAFHSSVRLAHHLREDS